MKTLLKGLSLEELETFVHEFGEKKYRARQLFSWMYRRNATSFAEMTDISLTMRNKLESVAELHALKLHEVQQSKSGDTRKYLFRLADGASVETVFMLDGDRRTLCISTQVGCPVDCKFCATGLMGLKRNLERGEIVDQVLAVQRAGGKSVTNIVVMGMGEPMLNYDNLMQALDILCADAGPDIARRHVVVSTSGILPAIERFIDEKKKYRLAISLNATTNEQRSKIIPINRKWPIEKLLQAARRYTQSSRERITIEYVLLGGFNDTIEDARRLRNLLHGLRCKVNLIPYNQTMRGFRRPETQTVEQFYHELASLRAPVTIRWSKGQDIDAACGQLWTKVEKQDVKEPHLGEDNSFKP